MKLKTKPLVQMGLTAALYAVLTLAFSFFSFGPLQFRIAEVMTLLPVFSPYAIVGLTLGCALSNAVGLAIGVNPLGALDVVFGTLATFAAAVLTYLFRNLRLKDLPLLAAAFPVLCNALFVGGELTFLYTDTLQWQPFLIHACGVAIPEAVIVYGIGIWLVRFVEKRRISLY